MYGINLQLFNSKPRISIFDNVPKKLHFAQKNCTKLKFRFMRNFCKKVFPVLRKLRKKNSAKLTVFHAQKFAKKKLRKNTAHFTKKI